MKSSLYPIIVVAGSVAALFWLVSATYQPAAIGFQHLSRDSFFGTLAWLFVVAAFLERAVEVVIMVLRDDGADARQRTIRALKRNNAEALRAQPAALIDLAPLHAAQADLGAYRAVTKEIALCISFVFGLFVSLAGVRALSSIVVGTAGPNWLFTAADILLTGALLAGGSDHIHKIANLFSNFMDAAATKVKQ